MRTALLGVIVCAVLAACTLPIDPRTDHPMPQERSERTIGNPSDVSVDVPHQHHRDQERADAAARCAQYGRVESYHTRHDGTVEYDCVAPGDAGH